MHADRWLGSRWLGSRWLGALPTLPLAGAACVDAGTAARPANEAEATESRCDSGFAAICEGFENAEVGELPRDFALSGYGRRSVVVSDEIAAGGSRSLRIEVEADQGPVVAMLGASRLGSLRTAHFGRLLVRIDAPAPSQFVHFDVVEASGPFEAEIHAVRWAATGRGAGSSPENWSWIYNVQPSESPEFGSEGDRSAHPRAGVWMCLEWRFDANAQQAELWYDGEEVSYLSLSKDSGDRTEIPSISTLSFGFQKFQETDAFTVWVDDFALDEGRIGCD